jgi:cell division protein FtsW (lipid II flippase)
MKISNKNNGLKWIILISALLIVMYWVINPWPITLQKKDQLFLQDLNFLRYEINLSAADFCASIKRDRKDLPCNSTSSELEKNITSELGERVLNEIRKATDSYESLKKILISETINNQYKFQLVEILEKRINELEKLRTDFSNLTMLVGQNKKGLQALLLAQGYAYNEYSDRFKLLNYDIARYVIQPERVKNQIGRLEKISNALPLIACIWMAIFLLLIRKKISFTGQIIFILIAILITFGLIIVRDASINFGALSNFYHLNPFRATLERQVLIVGVGLLIFVLLICIGNQIKIIIENIVSRLTTTKTSIACLFICSVAYLIGGQAIGSETIKIFTSLICALFITKNGRIIELLQENFKFSLYSKIATLPANGNLDANKPTKIIPTTLDYFSKFLITQLIAPISILFLTVVIASMVFNDLGGSLIASLVAVFSLYTLLGKKFATFILGFLALVTSLLILTSDKVRGRFQLMLDPMYANVSDFARLIEFNKSAQPYGYGPTKIEWCAGDGVCVPLQSLSDYMPTLISGMLGAYPSIVVFFLISIALIYLIYKLFMPAWYFSNHDRFLYMFTCLLLLATLGQLIITFFGNWRLMPLTGLGVPFASIGISSFMSGILGLGLAMTLVLKK